MLVVPEAARYQKKLGGSPFQEWRLPDGSPWVLFYRIGNEYLVRFPDLADFVVSYDGRAMAQYPVPGIGEPTIEHLYRSQALPLALSLQGELVFHGSCVDVYGAAVAFLGSSGRGKSTLAASLAREGCTILTDDSLVVRGGERYQVAPSGPSVRLWSDSEQAILGVDAKKMASVDYTSKGRFVVGCDLRGVHSPYELRLACFLGDGSSEVISYRRLTGAEALIVWIEHAFVLDAEDRSFLSRHFQRVADMANRVPSYALDYPRDYGILAELQKRIVEFVGAASNEIDR